MKNRFACYLITRILTARTRDCKLPAWASRHIESCETCRHESAAYTKLRSALMENAECEQVCGLSWSELKASLPERPETISGTRRMPAYAMAVVLIVIISVVGYHKLHQTMPKVTPNIIVKVPTQPKPDKQKQILQVPKQTVNHQPKIRHEKSMQVAATSMYHRHHRPRREVGKVTVVEAKIPTVTTPEASQPAPPPLSHEELSYETGRLIVTAVNMLAEQTSDSKCVEMEQKLKGLLLSKIRKIDPENS